MEEGLRTDTDVSQKVCLAKSDSILTTLMPVLLFVVVKVMHSAFFHLYAFQCKEGTDG